MRLDVKDRGDGAFPARLSGTLTTAPDRVFEARARRFVGAVLADDATAASRFVAYPLRVDGSVSFFVRRRAELIRRWRDIFTSPVLAASRAAIPHDMVVTANGWSVEPGDGVGRFDARGLETINHEW